MSNMFVSSCADQSPYSAYLFLLVHLLFLWVRVGILAGIPLFSVNLASILLSALLCLYYEIPWLV